jgi:Tfp pilus assembly protein PilF
VGTISSRQIRIAAVWLPVDGAEPALKYLNDRLPKEAQEHLEGMLQRSRTLPASFYYDLGLVYEVNGRLDDAEAMYKRAAALEPNELFIKAIRDVRQSR